MKFQIKNKQLLKSKIILSSVLMFGCTLLLNETKYEIKGNKTVIINFVDILMILGSNVLMIFKQTKTEKNQTSDFCSSSIYLKKYCSKIHTLHLPF